MKDRPVWSEDIDLPSPRAGVDEAGRGCLAGPVVAAAVILRPDISSALEARLNDSKKLSAARREDCFAAIVRDARCFAVGRASAREIDRLNILKASLLAMRRAVEQLPLRPIFVRVDGNRCPDWRYPSVAVIGGDARVREIAAASIIAKVVRDREMAALESEYPGYGFSRHKGYPTRAHVTALAELGPCAIHRCSFGPVAAHGSRGLRSAVPLV